jgi:hypothetical protein
LLLFITDTYTNYCYIRFIVSILSFKKDGRFYNPSRVDPKELTHLAGTSARKDKILLSVVSNPSEVAVALSVVTVKDSHLHKPKTWPNNKVCKLFTGKLLSQEDLLWASGLLMALGLMEVKGPVSGGWITFNCRPMDSGKSDVILF